jgi:NTE family protein
VADGRTAFVLGGGGVLGAVEVGMLRALTERDIRPDFVVGTSIGALNGVLIAADPTDAVIAKLMHVWASPQAREVFGPARICTRRNRCAAC